MDEFYVDYNNKKGLQKYFHLIFAIYAAVLGLCLCVNQALVDNYSIVFVSTILLSVLSIILVLNILVWHPKPLLCIDHQQLSFNFPGQKPYTFNWDEVKDINIGISTLIVETSSKKIKIDVSSLVYSDLKNMKAKLVEMCENKNISFRNN